MSIKIIALNKKARFDYHLTDTFEAGLVLTGSEVKSLRNNQCQLKDSYVAFVGNEAFLQNAHISEYRASSYNNHKPERPRKLLLNRQELDKLFRQVEEKKMSCVPTKIYFKRGKVKVEIALAKGKKAQDKRDAVKTRDVKREISSRLRRDR